MLGKSELNTWLRMGLDQYQSFIMCSFDGLVDEESVHGEIFQFCDLASERGSGNDWVSLVHTLSAMVALVSLVLADRPNLSRLELDGG